MFKKILTSVSIAAIALLGTTGAIENLEKIEDSGLVKTAILSSEKSSRASITEYEYKGLDLLSVGINEFTFQARIRDTLDDGYTLSDLNDQVIAGSGELLSAISFNYKINGVSYTSNWAEDTSSLESYVNVSVDNFDTENEMLYLDFTIHNSQLTQGKSVSEIVINPENEVFTTIAGAGGMNIVLEVNDQKNELIVLEGVEGNTSSPSPYFIMPSTLYVNDSLEFGEVTNNSIEFSFKLNGGLSETSSMKPIVTYEDPEYPGKQRIMSTKVTDSYETAGTDGYLISTYSYNIDGVANATTGSKESLQSNKEYSNIRVYIGLDTSDIDGSFLSEDVTIADAMNPTGDTLTTTAKKVAINSYDVTDVSQTTASFYIDFNASGIDKSDSSVLDSKEWNQYAHIIEEDLEVAYSATVEMSGKADIEAPVITEVHAEDWIATDDNLIRGEFLLTGLTPETEYNVFTDIDRNTGTGLTQLTKFKTEDYDPYDFADVAISNVSYTSADVTLTMNSNIENIYDLDSFMPTKVRAYYDMEEYDGDTTIFTPDYRLNMDFNEEESTDTVLKYTITDLNSEINSDGITYDGVRFIYTNGGYIDPASVSESTSITTKPLENVEIGTDVDGNFDVVQTGETISTINISVPELTSAGNIGSAPTYPSDAYQKIKYGTDGNLQFAIKPIGLAAKDTTEDGFTILNSDEVVINGPTSFVLKLNGLAAEVIEGGTGSSYEFELKIGTLDSDGNWVWTMADESIHTTPKLSPEVLHMDVAKATATQNDVDVTVEIKHAKDSDSVSEYDVFDPLTEIEFKGTSLANENGDYLTFDYNGEVAEEVVSDNEVISTYGYTLHNLRAQTHYSSIQTSIKGSEYVLQSSTNFDTQNKSMVDFKMTDDSENNIIVRSGTTYDSISFTVQATTGGNYKTVEGDGINDLSIKVSTAFGPKLNIDDFTIEPLSETEFSKKDSSTSSRYNHEDEEVTSTYEVTMNGLANPDDILRIIDIISISDNSGDVYGDDVKSTNPMQALGWATTPRKNVQFATGSIFDIVTVEGSEDASQGFEFVFDLNYGGAYMDFDPTKPYDEYTNPWDIRFFAVEGSTGNMHEYDIEFIEELEDEKSDSTHRLKYRVVGLKPNKTYSNITLTIDGLPGQTGNEVLNKEIKHEGSFTTSSLRSPVLAESFFVSSDEITNESFKFSISVLKGAENSTINNEGYDTFSPYFATLGYKNEALQDIDLNTSFVAKNEYSTEEEMSRATEYDTYKFEVSGLEANKTYGQLYFKYNAKETSRVELTGRTVTTKSSKSPFDPLANPIEFDYNSVTDSSFQFSMYVTSSATKGEYFGFAANETEVISNYARRETTLVEAQKNITRDDSGANLDKYTYEVSGLTASTTYSNFSITINSQKGKTENDTSSITYDRVTYSIPYAYIVTSKDMTKVYIGAGSSIIVALLLIILLAIYYFMIWYKKHIALAIYGDPTSLEAGTVVFRIINGKKHKKFRETPLDQMRLFVGMKEIPSTFVAHYDSYGELTDDYKIVTNNVVGNNPLIVLLLAGTKYDSFEISYDGGKTIQPIPTIRNNKLTKVSKNFGNNKKFDDAMKKYSKKSKGKNNSGENKNTSEAFVAIDKALSTSNSLRYEAIIPEGHPIQKNKEFFTKNLMAFYQVDKQLYPFEVDFVGSEGAIYSWDFINLEESTAYVNIHFSFDKGKTIIASLANYGVTLNSKERQVSLENAVLASAPLKKTGKGKGIETEKGYDLPKLKTTIEYLGHKLTERVLEVSIQKHIQRDTEEWVPHKKIGNKFVDYVSDWYTDIDSLKASYELHSFLTDWNSDGNEKKLSEFIDSMITDKKGTTKKTK